MFAHLPGMGFDAAIQTTSQSLAFRLSVYFSSDSLVVPRWARPSQAVEVGPLKTPHIGPCVVLLLGLRCTLSEWMAWFVECPVIRRVCVRVYPLPGHVAPVPGTQLPALLEAVVRHGIPDETVRLQCMPRAIEQAVADHLEAAGCTLNPQEGQFDLVLSIVRLQDSWRFGYTPAEATWRLSPTAQALHGRASSSAYNKLYEALCHCGTVGRRLQGAIDLGAAPGAWTELLADVADVVVAIDPANLSAQCAARSNVRHVQRVSEEALQEAQAALVGKALEVLVCDMNTLLDHSVACVAPLLPLLAPGGHLVMTCKMHGRGRDRSVVERQLSTMPVFQHLEETRMVWLLANTANERTFIARARGTPR